jgi:hypothetical protein
MIKDFGGAVPGERVVIASPADERSAVPPDTLKDRGDKVIEAASPLSSGGFVAAGADSDYFSSDRHYESLAGRMVAALRDRGRFVLVTGDPLPNPQVLSRALNKVVGFRYTVIVMPCGPELTCEDLRRAVPILGEPTGMSTGAVEPECPIPSSPLFVFDNFDRLSDSQIRDVCEATLHRDQMRASGVLLAPSGFLSRLERPALHFLREHLAAQVCVQEFGDSEAIAFLHNQLLAQRDRRIEARRFRHGILIGLVACGAVSAASITTLFILHPTAEQVRAVPENAGDSSLVSEEMAMLRPSEEAVKSAMQAAPKTETTSAFTTAPAPLTAPPLPPKEADNGAPVVPSGMVDSPPGTRVSASEITALLGRGDAFLITGDITSARLFYERAADAGNGVAALRLGATFDPVILLRAGGRGITADPAQALSWYRRARELGVSEAEQRIKDLETRLLGGSDTRPQ